MGRAYVTRKSVSDLTKALAFVEREFRRNPSLAEIARPSGLEPDYFQHVFRLACGTTPKQIVQKLRVIEVQRMILAGMPLGKIPSAAGFPDQAYMSAVFRAHVGTSPARWRRQPDRQILRYTRPTLRRALVSDRAGGVIVGIPLLVWGAVADDLHQPLHCAERNGDKGGNGRLVFFPGRKKAVNLHTVWDTFILPQSKGKRSVAEYGAQLHERITDRQAEAWAAGTPAQWAVESWRVAREHVYTADVPADGDPPKLGEEYVTKAQPVVDEQIQKAGVRLATALNIAFR